MDHADIVAAVADAGDAFTGVGADEESDAGFLGGGAAAGDHGRELDSGRDEGAAVVNAGRARRIQGRNTMTS